MFVQRVSVDKTEHSAIQNKWMWYNVTEIPVIVRNKLWHVRNHIPRQRQMSKFSGISLRKQYNLYVPVLLGTVSSLNSTFLKVYLVSIYLVTVSAEVFHVLDAEFGRSRQELQKHKWHDRLQLDSTHLKLTWKLGLRTESVMLLPGR